MKRIQTELSITSQEIRCKAKLTSLILEDRFTGFGTIVIPSITTTTTTTTSSSSSSLTQPLPSLSKSQILLENLAEGEETSLISVEFLGLPKSNPNYVGIDNKIDIKFNSRININLDRLTLAAFINFILNSVDIILSFSPKIKYILLLLLSIKP